MENQNSQEVKRDFFDKIVDWIEDHVFVAYAISLLVAMFLAGLVGSVLIFIYILIESYV
jgi:hypothetical protein